jgi:phage gpG-like protein
MTPEEFSQRLEGLAAEFREVFVRQAPAIAGRVAVSLFKKNFREEGFFGEAWQEVQRRQEWRRTPGKGSRRPADARRKILTGRTGDLGRSIEWKITGTGEVTILTTPEAFSSREPYGRVHNEGLRSGRGEGFRMPKRQFIGDHPTLRRAIAEKLEERLGRLRDRAT